MRLIALLVASLLIGNGVSAILVNRTIDDTLGDSVTGQVPVYVPAYLWSPGQNCSGCAAKPNGDLAFDKTWHDVEYNLGLGVSTAPTMTLTFNGSAIYVFCILGNTNTPATLLAFTLDGTSAGTYQHIPIPDTPYTYNQSVFSREGLNATTHSLEVALLKDTVDSGNNTLLLFDYAAYTVEEDDSSPSPPSATSSTSSTSHKSIPIGAVVGGVVGGVAFLALMAALFIFYRRRSHARSEQLLPHPLLVDSRQSGSETEKMPAIPSAGGAIGPYVAPVLTSSSPSAPITTAIDDASPMSAAVASTVARLTDFEKRGLVSASSALPSSSVATFPISTIRNTGAETAASVPLASSGSTGPVITETTDPQTQQQIERLWEELRVLRANQEMQLSSEPLPEYMSASSEIGTERT